MELQQALEAAEWRYEIEGLSIRVPLEHKTKFVHEVALHYTVLRGQGMLDQFISGLHYYEVSVGQLGSYGQYGERKGGPMMGLWKCLNVVICRPNCSLCYPSLKKPSGTSKCNNKVSVVAHGSSS